MQYDVKIKQPLPKKIQYPYFGVFKTNLETDSESTLIVYFTKPDFGIAINHGIPLYNTTLSEWVEEDFLPIEEDFIIQIVK